MDEKKIKETVLRELLQVAPEADLDQLDPSENIRESLDIDSFDYLNFLIALNDDLGIEIPESDYDRFSTLEGIISYISSRIN